MIRIACCCIVALLLCTHNCRADSSKVLFRHVQPDGAIYYVKTTKEANVYHWYDGRDRCVARKKKDKVLSVACPNWPVLESHMDDGDVLVSAPNGERMVFAKGSLFYTMFISIMGE